MPGLEPGVSGVTGPTLHHAIPATWWTYQNPSFSRKRGLDKASMLHFPHMKLAWNWKRWPFAVAAFALAAVPALAHEKWYVEHGGVDFARSVITYVSPSFAMTIIALASVGFVAAAWLDRRLDSSGFMHWFDKKLSSFTFNPRTVLGVCVGVSLMGAGLKGTLFAPSLVLGGDPWSVALGIAQIGLGSLFLFLEPAYSELGLLLGLLFMAGIPVLPFWDLMEELYMLGAAIFFMMGASDRSNWRFLKTPEAQRLGYQALRILTGLCFLVLASVKWLHPEFAIAIVDEYRLNFLAPIGGTDAHFIFLAAVVETLVALCVLLRVAFRPAVAAAFFLFLISIYFLGFQELLGHLPVKAALFMMFLYGHWHKGEVKA